MYSDIENTSDQNEENNNSFNDFFELPIKIPLMDLENHEISFSYDNQISEDYKNIYQCENTISLKMCFNRKYGLNKNINLELYNCGKLIEIMKLLIKQKYIDCIENNTVFATKIISLIESIIKNPTKYCLICRKLTNKQEIFPTTCSDLCDYQYSTLCIHQNLLDKFKQDINVSEMLMYLFFNTFKSKKHMDLLNLPDLSNNEINDIFIKMPEMNTLNTFESEKDLKEFLKKYHSKIYYLML